MDGSAHIEHASTLKITVAEMEEISYLSSRRGDLVEKSVRYLKERAKAIDMLQLIISMIICRFAGLVGSVSRCPCVTEGAERSIPPRKRCYMKYDAV